MAPADRPPLHYLLLAGALIAAYLAQAFAASRLKTVAWDEPGHIAAGLSYLRTGEFRVNIQHPPLLKEICALSARMAGARWPSSSRAQQLFNGNSSLQWAVGSDIIAAGGPDRVMFWCRLPFILLAALLGALLYIWGRQMLGDLAALGALFLYVFDPIIIAHSFLVTTDSGFAAFTVLFLFALWHYLRYPSPKRLVWCGLAMGAVLCTKFSAVALLPVGALLMLAAMRWPPAAAAGRPRTFLDPYGARDSAETSAKAGPNDPCPCGSGKKFKKCHGAAVRAKKAGPALGRQSRILIAAGAFLAMCVVAVVLVEAIYFFPSDPLLYVKGMSLVNADHDPNYPSFLAGWLQPRFLTYFAATYLLKEPLAGVILALFGLLTVARSRSMPVLDKLFLLLTPAILFVLYTLRADNLGVRYIVPILPFAFLLGGVGLAALLREASIWKRGLAAVLGAWIIVAAAGIYPDHLSYFNEMACVPGHLSQIGLDGGSRCGPLWLDDSNVDWGLELKGLRAWLDRHAKGRSVRFAYFGSFPPESYGIHSQIIAIPDLVAPEPGLTVVSAHLVARVPALGDSLPGKPGSWLRTIPPVAILGHALYVYDIPPGAK